MPKARPKGLKILLRELLAIAQAKEDLDGRLRSASKLAAGWLEPGTYYFALDGEDAIVEVCVPERIDDDVEAVQLRLERV